MVVNKSLEAMRSDWDRRAQDDALYWVYTVHGRKFENLSAYYEDGARHAVTMLTPSLEEWQQDPAGKTLLEIGCGIGRLFPGFSKLGFSRIIGLDVSPQMVSRGREWCPVRDAEFVLVDGDRLTGIESGSVDYVFSYNVFQHLPAASVFWHNMEEMSRVIKPGGYFQFHFRGGYTLKQRVLRRVPDSLLPTVRTLYRKALRKQRLRPGTDFDDPGGSHTWEFGIAVSPERVSRRLEALGFTGMKIEADIDYSDGMRFWARGRKGAA